MMDTLSESLRVVGPLLANQALLLGWITLAACVAVGAALKGRRPVLWCAYALVLLPFAILHLLFAGQRDACPWCRAPVRPKAKTCPQCRKPLAAGGGGDAEKGRSGRNGAGRDPSLFPAPEKPKGAGLKVDPKERV